MTRQAKLELPDFVLQRATLEVRYEPAYLIWDKSGSIWHQVKQRWPELINKSANPNQTSFSLPKKYDLTVEHDKTFLISHRQKIERTLEDIKFYIDLVRKTLDIKSYSRIGARFFYEKKFNTEEEAINSFINANVINIPTGRQLNIEGKVSQPQYVLKLENEDIGVRVSLQVANKKIEFNPPNEITEIEQIKIESNLILFDIDYYTKTNTNTGQVDISYWFNQAYHLVKRDSNSFLGQ